MKIEVKRFENSFSALANAFLLAFAYGVTPYFLVYAYGQIVSTGFFMAPAIILGVFLFIMSLVYGYKNNAVDTLIIEDKRFIHVYSKWGRLITDSINISDIESTYVAPRTKRGGAVLYVQAKNPINSIAAGNYPLHKLQQITDHLRQYMNANGKSQDFTDDTSVVIKRLKKAIFIVTGVILVPFIIFIIYIFASTS